MGVRRGTASRASRRSDVLGCWTADGGDPAGSIDPTTPRAGRRARMPRSCCERLAGADDGAAGTSAVNTLQPDRSGQPTGVVTLDLAVPR